MVEPRQAARVTGCQFGIGQGGFRICVTGSEGTNCSDRWDGVKL